MLFYLFFLFCYTAIPSNFCNAWFFWEKQLIFFPCNKIWNVFCTFLSIFIHVSGLKPNSLAFFFRTSIYVPQQVEWNKPRKRFYFLTREGWRDGFRSSELKCRIQSDLSRAKNHVYFPQSRFWFKIKNEM